MFPPHNGRMNKDPLFTRGANIRHWREKRGFTQEGFSQHIQLDRAYYGRIERGKQNVSVKTLVMLGAKLNVSPAEFLSGITPEDCTNYLKYD